MICKNCGAKYDENELICPYCNYENLEQAIEEQEDFIDNYENKTQNIKNEPQKAVKAVGKVIYRLVFAAIIVFGVILAIAYIFKLTMKNDSLGGYKEDIAVLEEYYNQGDYKKLFDYFENMENKYSTSYDKYEIVCDMYDDFLFVKEEVAEAVKIFEHNQYDSELLAYYIYLGSKNIKTVEELRENGYVYGEEKAAEYFEKNFRDVMVKYLKMTNEEIDNAVAIYNDDESLYYDMCDELAKRMYIGGND